MTDSLAVWEKSFVQDDNSCLLVAGQFGRKEKQILHFVQDDNSLAVWEKSFVQDDIFCLLAGGAEGDSLRE